jgi:hypothetical protein
MNKAIAWKTMIKIGGIEGDSVNDESCVRSGRRETVVMGKLRDRRCRHKEGTIQGG